MNTALKLLSCIGIIAAITSCSGPAKEGEKETVELNGISLDKQSIELKEGECSTLYVIFTPENAEHSNAIWASSDENIASVSSDGTITANNEGQCTVSVYVNSFSADCEVTVKSDRIPVESIILDKETAELNIGESFRISATVFPENADDKSVSWSSSDGNVASVADGLVTALAAGTAVITASSGEVSAECTVSVRNAPPQVGDFYYSDGSYSSELDESKTPIAVVFWVGDPGADDPALKADHPECTNGLAVSLTEENNAWQSGYGQYNNTVGSWIEANCPELVSTVSDVRPTDNLNKRLGYNNTKGIESFNSDAANASWNVDAVSALMFFRLDDKNKTPESSSGWYLPSAKDLATICYGDYCGEDMSIWDITDAPLDNIGKVNESMGMISGATTLGSIYWSSTELNNFSSYCFIMSNGNTAYDNKSSRSSRLRFILAF